jgi:hypothetical protein
MTSLDDDVAHRAFCVWAASCRRRTARPRAASHLIHFVQFVASVVDSGNKAGAKGVFTARTGLYETFLSGGRHGRGKAAGALSGHAACRRQCIRSARRGRCAQLARPVRAKLPAVLAQLVALRGRGPIQANLNKGIAAPTGGPWPTAASPAPLLRLRVSASWAARAAGRLQARWSEQDDRK